MGWIKRNLFFVIGAAVALLLLGAGGYYIFTNWSQNAKVSEKLDQVYSELKTLKSKSPAPGNDKIDNTAIAKAQQAQVQAWIDSATRYFAPISPIPARSAAGSGANPVTSEAFASALRRTVDLLQREADAAGVILPPKYDFSFTAQRPLVKFAEGSLEPLSVQLGEVKAISEAVFAARVNAIDSIQRVRVSADDVAGPVGDYTDRVPVTNELAVLTPYVVTFRCFTPELASVLGQFAKSTNAMLIKSINVQPAGMASALTPMGGPGMPGMNPAAIYNRNPELEINPAARYPGMPQPGVAPMPAKGGLQTVLKEQLLRVTMEVELVKLLSRN
jgi:hypothetical protein